MFPKSMLIRVVVITAIVSVAALGLAAIIGFAAGGFNPRQFGRAGQSIDERQSVSLDEIDLVSIVAVSEDVRIVEGTGDSIEAWFHGTVGSNSQNAIPHLVAGRNGRTAEIRVGDRTPMLLGFFWSDLVLEVSVPKAYAKRLSVTTVSAGVNVADHAYAGLEISTTSGDVKVEAVRAAEVSMHTTSGELRAARIVAERVSLSSVSGDVDVKSLSGDTALRTTSGQATLVFEAVPARLDAVSTSGDLSFRLPADAQFTLDARSTSGDVRCAFPIAIGESRSGGGSHVLTGTVGTSANALAVRTVSGEIRIQR
jgi:lia operon protein LiaG